MRYLVIFLVALSAFFKTYAANNDPAYWQKANLYYEQKQYDSAAYYYELIAARNPDNAVVYYNLGNTYYRLNLVGPAVLNYEKALHIKPGFKQAEDNLTLTQARISNRIQPMQQIFFLQWWNALTCAGKSGLWATLSIIIFLAIIGLLVARLLKKGPRIPQQVLVALVCINALFLLFAVTSAANKANSGRGVVMQNDAPMYASPSQQGKATNLVPEGTTVELLNEKATWIEIKLPDGRVGWIEGELVSHI